MRRMLMNTINDTVVVTQHNNMMRIQLIIVLASLICIATSFRLHGTAFKDCGSQFAELMNVTVTPCDTTPCSLYRGEKAQVAITFRTKEVVKSGKATVHGIIARVPVPFPLDDKDLCKFTEPKCEIPADTVAVYTYSLPVLKEYPAIRLTVKWELKGEDESEIVCALIPVQIADRS
ncbi:Epididymal secretory protein E1 [Fasciola gigantica]|uniref:Epididymal secretory protein E1 n=1 Tax=Fasciola gigantica TaxID=46835 RepID=A0A504YJ38_FASGI|nr:Epididymal secretory protein E1 [Fasciola gigantica]